jgi:hypothetical protein
LSLVSLGRLSMYLDRTAVSELSRKDCS